jgi:hypothetical protein
MGSIMLTIQQYSYSNLNNSLPPTSPQPPLFFSRKNSILPMRKSSKYKKCTLNFPQNRLGDYSIAAASSEDNNLLFLVKRVKTQDALGCSTTFSFVSFLSNVELNMVFLLEINK